MNTSQTMSYILNNEFSRRYFFLWKIPCFLLEDSTKCRCDFILIIDKVICCIFISLPITATYDSKYGLCNYELTGLSKTFPVDKSRLSSGSFGPFQSFYISSTELKNNMLNIYRKTLLANEEEVCANGYKKHQL